ncbi:MAG: ribonuclease E/G [Rubricella sp.]
MKGRAIAMEPRPDGEGQMAALMVDGRLHDLLIDPPDDRLRPGQIWRGLPDRPMKGMGGVMVRLGQGRTAFLKEAKGIAPGQPVLIQITGHAEPGKAPPATRRLVFKSRYAIATPDAEGVNVSRAIRDDDQRAELARLCGDLTGQGEGLVIRTAARHADHDTVVEDAERVLDLARTVLADPGREAELLLDAPDAATTAWMEWSDPEAEVIDEGPGAFERHGVWEAIDALKGPVVPLSGSASMAVEPTRALIAVDVNTGGETGPAAALRVNTEALRALPSALRLRGLAGQVVVDLAPVAKKDRARLESVLKAALKADPVSTTFLGWTPLGHIELRRRRERLPLREVLPK